MDELFKKVAELFGDRYVAAVGYGALAYLFFYVLDEKLSDEAKAALARTMRFKDYKKEQVASALVEVFDRIYTYPLLRWRAFFRSLIFTTVVSAIYLYEEGSVPDRVDRWLVFGLLLFLTFNASTDYLSLFLIRPVLIRSGTKPVIGLGIGAVIGVAIVLTANAIRILIGVSQLERVFDYLTLVDLVKLLFDPRSLVLAWPALAVFVWLPLFAFGILTARALTPLSWVVGRTQWFLKEGKRGRSIR